MAVRRTPVLLPGAHVNFAWLSAAISASSILSPSQDTGDGAGILCGIPDRFMRRVAAELSVELPPPREQHGWNRVRNTFCCQSNFRPNSLKHSFGAVSSLDSMPLE